VLSNDERYNNAESETDYNNLDVHLRTSAGDYFDNDNYSNRDDGIDNNQCVSITDCRRSASPCYDTISSHTTEPPLHPQAAKGSTKRMNYDGLDEPGDDDIFDVFAEDDANKASEDAQPAKQQTKRRKLSAVSCSNPTPNSGTLDPQVCRSPQRAPAAAGVQHRRHKGDTRNRPTSPIEPATAVRAPSTTPKTTNLEEPRPGALVTDPGQEWGIRNIIGRKILGDEVHYLLDWEPTRMLESELAGAKELVDGFVVRLQITERRSGSRGGRGNGPLKQGQQEAEPKKQRGRPRKQT
jgi:hypothetical protein